MEKSAVDNPIDGEAAAVCRLTLNDNVVLGSGTWRTYSGQCQSVPRTGPGDDIRAVRGPGLRNHLDRRGRRGVLRRLSLGLAGHLLINHHELKCLPTELTGEILRVGVRAELHAAQNLARCKRPVPCVMRPASTEISDGDWHCGCSWDVTRTAELLSSKRGQDRVGKPTVGPHANRLDAVLPGVVGVFVVRASGQAGQRLHLGVLNENQRAGVWA